MLILDESAEDLILAAHRGLPPGLLARAKGLRLARMLATVPALASQLAIPLKSKGSLQGALIVGKSGIHNFLPEEISLLTAIATQVGIATDNIRLHQDVAIQLEREISLAEVAKEIASELELDRVLSSVVQIAEKLVGADAAVISLLDEGKDMITYPHLHNLPKELEQVTVPKGEGLTGLLLYSCRS